MLKTRLPKCTIYEDSVAKEALRQLYPCAPTTTDLEIPQFTSLDIKGLKNIGVSLKWICLKKPMTYYKKRVDENQKSLIHTFICLGASVLNLSTVGRGCPDLLIGYKGKTVLVEIKSSTKATFTEPQIKFMQEWRGGAVSRIDSVDAAIRLIKMLDME